MRHIVTFDCEGCRLVGTVDGATGTTGLLIVSGGNEPRCGAHRGMGLLASRLAAAGTPVFRFDRRGVGDAEGENGGWSSCAPDLAAAAAAFRREQPHLRRLVGFGNCDAATALALHDRQCAALVLANPWLGDEDAPLPPAALRGHYVRRMASPAAWRRLLTGGPSPVLRSLRDLARSTSEQPLAARMATALAGRAVTIVLAATDRTARVFAAARIVPHEVRMVTIDTASHSFAGADAALEAAIRAAVDDK